MRLFQPVLVALPVAIGETSAVVRDPDSVVLDETASERGHDLIGIEQISVAVTLQLVSETFVQLLNEINQVAQVVTRQQPSHRVLHGDEIVADKRQNAVGAIPPHGFVQVAEETLLGIGEQPLIRRRIVIGQPEELQLRQERAQWNLDQLKVVFRSRMRWIFRQLRRMVEEDVIAFGAWNLSFDLPTPPCQRALADDQNPVQL